MTDERKAELLRELRHILWRAWPLVPEAERIKKLCPHYLEMLGCYDCPLEANVPSPADSDRSVQEPIGVHNVPAEPFDPYLSYYDIPEEELAYAALTPDEEEQGLSGLPGCET